MPIALETTLTGATAVTHEAIMAEMGLPVPDDTARWLAGAVNHVAAEASDGRWIVDLRESRNDFDAFAAQTL